MDMHRPSDGLQCLPDTLLIKAANVGNEIGTGLIKEQLLPELSRVRYEEEYNKFCEWCKVQNVKPSNVNDEVLLVYLSDKSKGMKPSTLWSIFYIMKTCLKSKEKLNLDFPKTTKFLKQQSLGFKPEKTSVFTLDELTRFMLKAPDKEWLLCKVVVILFIYGSCRIEELLEINAEDVKDSGSFLTVFLKDMKSKKKKFSRRSFSITDEGCLFQPCTLIRRYLSLRPPHMEGKRLLVAYRGGKCVAQNVGCHTVSGVPKRIAAYLKLKNPNSYKAKGMRLTSVLMEGGFDVKGNNCYQESSQNSKHCKLLQQNCDDGICDSDYSSNNEDIKVPTSFNLMDVSDSTFIKGKEKTQESDCSGSEDDEDDLASSNIEVEAKIEEGGCAQNIHNNLTSIGEQPLNISTIDDSNVKQLDSSKSVDEAKEIDLSEVSNTDESEYFGAYVASSLRALHHEFSRAQLKSLIHKAIQQINHADKMSKK